MPDANTDHIEASDAATNPAAVRERLQQSGHVEELAAGDEPIGYVMSADTYEVMRAAADAEMIRIGHEQSLRGEVRSVDDVFADLRARLLRTQAG